MNTIVKWAALCLLIGFSTESWAQDTNSQVDALLEQLDNFDISDTKGLEQLKNTVDELVAEAVESDSALYRRRDLITGGFRMNMPNAVVSGDWVQINSKGKVLSGALSAAVVGGLFRLCNHQYTNIDDWIRWTATFEGANLMAQGLGWEVVTLAEDINNVIATGEILAGLALLGIYKSNKNKDGADSTANNPATLLCSPATALVSVGFGVNRLYSSYSHKVTFPEWFGTVFTETKDTVLDLF